MTTRTISQYKDKSDKMSDADSRALASQYLRERFRENGEVMTTDPVPSEPTPVRLNADRTGWDEIEDGSPDGHVIVWTADGSPMANDEGILIEGGVKSYDVPVPQHVTEAGGPVRVRHGLGCPVIVSAYGADGEKMGYLVTMVIDENEEHVELFSGVTRIHVDEDTNAVPGT